MAKEVSKTQIDRLGDRLKKGNITEDDLRLLDQYRRSFTEAYDIVVGDIRQKLGLEPTGRPAKSTTSISEKLRRESIRLTQIQDIAGCRLTVSDIAEQDWVVQALSQLFEHDINDRRQKPSHGYRAVHVIASWRDKMIEIQVRTSLQHLWAELSEKFSDVVDPSIKYGGGDENVRKVLTWASSIIAREESLETEFMNKQALLPARETETPDVKQRTFEIQKDLSDFRQDLHDGLRDIIERLRKLKENY